MNNRIKLIIAALLIATKIVAAEQFITFNGGDLLLNEGKNVSLYVDSKDERGVALAAKNVASDITKVTGCDASVVNDESARIVAGTVGHSALIDKLIKQKKIDGKTLKGKLEKYVITVIDGQLVIAGSDRRGTIFGLYELSKQMGVSPWYWWADVPVEKHEKVYANKGIFTDNEPAVRYRGIFLNDEAPCLTSWVKNQFGTEYGGHEFYAKVFELILRLKGNMLWPAMWGWAFYADDPLNSKTADEMGVVIGTSHHEPMARNHQEWARHRNEYGAWNYQTNKQVIDKFFREGIERMNGTDDIVTIGMRGDGDEAMSEDADTKLLQDIVDNQRKIIKEVTGKKASETPQVWALYKEVLDYYDKGMKVPDDVTFMLCDDNWGNVRRVPNAKERQHPGGWGLYYHVDYVGAPRNSKWLNMSPTQHIWEQLSLAYENGLDRIWILNVGDLKPMEYPIQLFLDMAWKPNEYTAQTITQHTERYCTAQFGESNAKEAARILNLYGKYAGRVTAEMLDASTYNIETGEWQKVADQWMRLEAEALRQFVTLPSEYRDAYQQLVLFPVQAMSNLHQMYYAQAMNLYLASSNNAEANAWADKCEEAFRRDSILCRSYNKDIAGGKWNGMMTQKHIGYRSWNDNFPKDMLPRLHRVENATDGGFLFTGSHGYVAMEAEHYFSLNNAKEATWTVIPDAGRTLSGITLRPTTTSIDGASLTYKFNTEKDIDKVRVHVVVKSTLDFLNKGGLEYTVSLDGKAPQKVNFNSDLNEKPENIYSKYYPTIARRVIENTLDMESSNGKEHTLTFTPLDPGIVLEKIVIDYGGYMKSYLFGEESKYRK